MNSDYLLFISRIPFVSSEKSKEYLKILKTLVSSCSKNYQSHLLSPYSITINHEFLGIPSSTKTALLSIFYLEEKILEWNIPFQLSYVLLHGEISSSISKKTSLRLMGEGISKARETLEKKKGTQPRILFHIKPQKLSAQFNRLFMVLDSLISGWNQKDFSLISDMLKNENNEEVAIKYRKNRSQIWKRRKTLKISEYKALKHVILELI
ncbi:MAG: SatD family protein [Acidobacteriota bacterium]